MVHRGAVLAALSHFGMAVVAIVLSMGGCHHERFEVPQDFPAPNVPNYQGLVSVHWVKRLLDHQADPLVVPRPATFSGERFVIVDAGWSGRAGTRSYYRGHVPGAVLVDTDDLETGYPRWQLQELSELQQAIGRMGIVADTTVIVYGSQLIAAARVWWAFKYAGVNDVRIMDGDFETWTAAGYPAERTTNVLVSVEFTAPARTDWMATTSSVRDALKDKRVYLADVRSDAEYHGRESGYDYLQAKGRIPGAIHLGDADDGAIRYRQRDGRLRPPSDVRAEWQRSGLMPATTGNRFERDVIFYCGGGWRSSVAFFYAWLLGFENIRNYSDGWCGWSTEYQPDSMATGSTPGWRQLPTRNPFEVDGR